MPWQPSAGRRTLVLGGGGTTGIAWEVGMLSGLVDAGIDLLAADTMIGTSAGAVVAAHARAGIDLHGDIEELFARNAPVPAASIGLADTARFLGAAMMPIPATRARAWLGRASLRAAVEGRLADEDAWIASIGDQLPTNPWPSGHLMITAVDADDGASVVFDNGSGAPLDRAVAASCSVPNIFPPVCIGSRRYIDGGARSIGNVDLAAGAERVLVLAPVPWAIRRDDRPGYQLRMLGSAVRGRVISADARGRAAMGRDVLDARRIAASHAAGRDQARRIAQSVAPVWN